MLALEATYSNHTALPDSRAQLKLPSGDLMSEEAHRPVREMPRVTQRGRNRAELVPLGRLPVIPIPIPPVSETFLKVRSRSVRRLSAPQVPQVPQQVVHLVAVVVVFSQVPQVVGVAPPSAFAQAGDLMQIRGACEI